MDYLNGFNKDTCGHCGLKRTAEGYDGCVGRLKGVMNACCGHGQDDMAYVQFDHIDYLNDPNKIIIKEEKAIEYIKRHRRIALS